MRPRQTDTHTQRHTQRHTHTKTHTKTQRHTLFTLSCLQRLGVHAHQCRDHEDSSHDQQRKTMAAWWNIWRKVSSFFFSARIQVSMNLRVRNREGV